MGEATCRTCPFGSRTSGRGGTEYQCRKAPKNDQGRFPSMQDHEWCGEHPALQRDQLAARAMQGMIAASGADPKQFPDTQDAFAAAVAQEAYAVADAMLREREKQSNRKET